MKSNSALDDLAPERSFVVQMRADCGPAPDRLRGRVEHVPTGLAARFESLHELASFMTETLAIVEGRAAPHEAGK